MNFKEWLETMIPLDDLDLLEDYSYIGLRDEYVLHKVFNILTDISLIKHTKLYKPEGYNGQIILVFEDKINVDEVFPIIRLINGFSYIDSINKENFKNIIIGKDIVPNVDEGNFYCLLTLNHAYYTLEYIEEVEKIINKHMTFYTNIDLLYEDFKKTMEDDFIASIIRTHAGHFGIMVFETAEGLDGYKDYIKNTLNEDTIQDFVNSVMPDVLEGIDLEDNAEINVKAYDPEQGKVIDIATYKKNRDNNKLN